MDRPYSKLEKIEEPRVYLATPIGKNSNLHGQTAAFCSYTSHLSSVVQWGYTNTLSAEMSRNTLIEDYSHITNDWTHVFFVDSDIVPPINCLDTFLGVDADVVVAMCPLFMDGFYWNVQGNDNEWIPMGKELPEEPFGTSLSGAGCFLARKEVLDDIGWPWFKMEYQPKYENDGQPIKQDEGEYFFGKVRDKGYRIIAHPKMICKHFNHVDLLEVFKKK